MPRFALPLALLPALLLAGCDSGTPGTAPTVSALFPSVLVPNGYLYVRGQNLDEGAVAVTFVAGSATHEGAVVEKTPTQLTVRVPAGIPTDGSALSVRVRTDGGTVDVTDRPVYGVPSSAFGDDFLPGRGLVGTVYPIPQNTTALPDFATLTPASVILAPNLNVAPRSFSAGFPGVPGGLVEWFAIRFDGRIEVPAAGTYTFRTVSDDGSKLYIDGDLVVDNDGVHGAIGRNGEVELTAGTHDVRVEYFQGPRYEIALQVFWQAAGTGAMEIVPSSAFLLPTQLP